MNPRFAINFFRWAGAYADKELGSDFPVIRQFEIPCVQLFLKWVQLLDGPRKKLLARGLVRRFHAHAAAILNEPLNPGEESAVKAYLEMGRSAFMTGAWRTARLACFDLVENRLTRKKLREQALAFLGGALGERCECDVPGCLAFESDIQGVVVRTFIFLRVRGADLAYHQEVWAPDKTRIQAGISMLGWLGISGGPTAWEQIGEQNVKQALSALRVGCQEFLSAVPSMTS